MNCPLPVELLDANLREFRQMDSHVSICIPCRLRKNAFEADMEKTRLLSLELSMPRQVRKWTHAQERGVRFGDIWWSVLIKDPKTDLSARVPVLIISDSWSQFESEWVHVVPLSSEIENASSLDLLFEPNETDLGVYYLALLRYQTVAATKHLESWFGTLRQTGFELLHQANSGTFAEERVGSPLDSQHDERLRVFDSLQRAMFEFGRLYAEATEEQSDQTRLTFRMTAVRKPIAVKEDYRLAAESAVQIPGSNWEVVVPGQGIISGRLLHDVLQDVLSFRIDHLTEDHQAFARNAWIIAHVAGFSLPIKSGSFIPRLGLEVAIATGQALVPSDVVSLEFQLTDES
jgi:hypothetical protein